MAKNELLQSNILLLLQQINTNIVAQSNTNPLFYSSGSQKSKIDLTGLKLKFAGAGCAALETLGENLFSQVLEAAYIPCLVAPSSILRASSAASSKSPFPSPLPSSLFLFPESHLLLFLIWASGLPLIRTLAITLRHPEDQDSVSISKSVPFLTSAKCLLPCEVAYSQGPGARIQTSWWRCLVWSVAGSLYHLSNEWLLTSADSRAL